MIAVCGNATYMWHQVRVSLREGECNAAWNQLRVAQEELRAAKEKHWADKGRLDIQLAERERRMQVVTSCLLTFSSFRIPPLHSLCILT